jgi:FMN-dependent NADH-azoreductase
MGKLLYITANPKPVEASIGLQVGEHFLAAYQKLNPNDTIERVDLYKEEIPLIDSLVLGAWEKLGKGQEVNEQEKQVLARMNEILEQFISADKYVFVTPLWNLSYPPMLKAYIDNIVIARKTFAYTENGPQGLLKNRKALHIQARGGVYSEGPAADFEFADKYLRGVLAFIGITDYQHVVAEGMAAFPEQTAEILEKAKKAAERAAASFAEVRQAN